MNGVREIDIVVEDAGWAVRLPGVEALVTEAAQAALSAATLRAPEGAIAVLLTNDAELQDLNARFRGKDKPTNVLSFPAATGSGVMGDVALALGVCAREAGEQGKSLAHHTQHLVAHGVLHLLGYDHENDAEAEVMEAVERAAMAALGAPDPYALTKDTEAQGAEASHG